MKVDVIGGGIGGMMAALLLAKRGFAVRLLEKNARLGGRLAYESAHTGLSGQSEYRIDQGPTIVLLPDMLLGVLEQAGIDRSALTLLECEPLCRIHYADGTVLHKWRDRRKQEEELERLFPGERDGYARFMRDMEQRFVAGKEAFLDRTFMRKRDFFTLRNMRLLASMRAYKSVRAVARSYFRDERLVDAFSLQTLYIGGAPFASPGLYALLPYAEHAFGVWYVKGGYASLVPVLERKLREQGVDVRLGTAVSQLIIEGGVCRGVVAGGERLMCDAVVFNGDYPQLGALLPEAEQANKRYAGLRKRYEPSSGCVLVYLGVSRRWADSAAHQFFLPPSLERSLRRIFSDGRLPEEPSYYVFNPTVIDESAAPVGESVLYMLIPCPPDAGIDWATEADALVRRVLADAERRAFPGLREAIRWQSVRTPADARADGLYMGGSFGIAPTLRQSALFRPQIVAPAPAGLYAVGASVHPGGGIPIVMQGAQLLAQHLKDGGTSHELAH